MRLVYHLKIGTRLGSGFAIVVGLTILLGVIALMEMKLLANLTRDLYSHPMIVSNTVRDIQGYILAMQRSMRDVILVQTDTQRQAAISQVNQEEEKVLQAFDTLYSRFLGDKADIDSARQRFMGWKPIRSEEIDLIGDGRKDQAAQLAQSKGAEQVLQINSCLQVVGDFAKQKADAFFNSAQESVRTHFWTMSGLILLISAVGILGGLLITRSITRPLLYVMEQIGRAAGGDLDHKINLNSDDEIGQLARTFDDMTASLKKIMASRNELDAANHQLEAANQQLQAHQQQLNAANQQLRASEQHKESIISTVPGVVYRLHRDADGVFSIPYISQQAESIIGHPLNILTNSDCFFDIIHSEDVENFRSTIRDSARTLESCIADFRVFDTNGRMKWLKSVSTPQQLADHSTIWNGIIIDITDRRQVEAQLQVNEERYRVVSDNTWTWEFWIDTEGRYVYISPSCQDVSGYTAEEFKTNPGLLRKIIYPQDRPVYQMHCMNADTCKVNETIEFRIITKENQVRWVEHCSRPIYDKSGKWIGTRGSNRDITDCRQRQKDIRYIRAALDAAGDAIAGILVDGLFVYQNKAFCQLLGYTPDELSALNIADLSADKEAIVRIFDVIKAGRSWLGQVEMIAGDRRPVSVSIRADAVKDETGTITGLIGVYTLATEAIYLPQSDPAAILS